MKISLESPTLPEVRQLIEALDAYQQPLYPPESHHGIDIDALAADDVLFAVARDEHGQAVACGAMRLEDGRAELKRFFTLPAQRGKGTARQLLAWLEARACQLGYREFLLETGYLQDAAIRFYESCGYVPCGPFGTYVDDPNSVFMRKRVA
ncbi:GNAT family N-acetyltransferase [Herbaspirillum huttiense]|jgi:putative acetyltransferase|uniref:GNAT family N-acetyltransferase n=1 Tax=Herbaspirillum huttiense TaxID=863372 RepID=UPI001AD0AC47|nr:GNAT family N-acetyltransferase [Herbaspirillum huttiense]MBN9359633.1 GNAT family N-acetyltransferase [Herbaspirillum huttiense]